MQNHYVSCLSEWQKKFQESGREMIQKHNKYPMISDRYIKIIFFNREYCLDLDDGILYEQDKTPCGLQPMMQMMIYSHLEYVQKDAVPGNQMVSLENIVSHVGSRRIIPVSPPEEALIRKIDENPAVIDTIVHEFGATRESMGDMSFSLYAFPDVKYQYVYWQGDEEFPSNLKVLTDRNILSYVHPEGAMLLAGMGIELICNFLGISYPKWSWEI